MMKVAIDLQVCQSREFRGINRYSLEFAKAVVKYGTSAGVDFRALLSGEHRDQQGVILSELGLPQTQYRHIYPARISENDEVNAAFDSLFLNRVAESGAYDIVHDSFALESFEKFALNVSPDNAHIHTATFYDLIPLKFQDEYLYIDAVKKSYLKQLEIYKRRDMLFAISESARQDGMELLGIPAEKIVNISAGVDEGLFTPGEVSAERRHSLLGRYGIRKPFLLYTTGLDPRKNVLRLVQAYVNLPREIREGYQLVIVCPRTDDRENIIMDICRKAGVCDGEDVVFTGFVSDGDLVDLYRLTRLFVFPSLYEGFGLPIVEAIRCGAPVIGSDCSSIVELLTEKDARFDPTSVQDIASAMVRVLRSGDAIKDLQRRERSHVGKYTWENVAKTAIEAWKDCASRKKIQRSSVSVPARLPTMRKHVSADRTFLKKIVQEAKCSGVSDVDQIAHFCVLNDKCSEESPRVLFDISWWINASITTGIQRVVSKIAAAFRSRKDGLTYQAVAIKNGVLYNCQYSEQSKRYVYADEWCCRERDLLIMLDSSWEWRDAFLPYFDEIKDFGGSVYSVVYDILPVLNPELFDQGIRTIFPLWLQHAIRNTDGAICISKSVGLELRQYIESHKDSLLGDKQFPIGHFYLGADFTSGVAQNGGQVDLPFGSNDRIVLSVGTIEPRKNHVYMLDVMERVMASTKDVCWVIVGQKGWFMDGWTKSLPGHSLFGKRIFYYPKADDAQLSALYDRAEFLLNLSKGEGYGLPLIEAGEKNKKVICSDIPVFHEIDRFGFTYCPLTDAQEAADIVLRALDADGAMSKVPAGIPTKFTWDDAGRMLVDCAVGNTWDCVVT